MELSMPTQEELAMAVAITPTPTPDHTYSTIASAPTPIATQTIVSSLLPIPAPIYSTVVTTSPIPSAFLPICHAITDMLRYALGQGPHPTLLTQQTTRVQSTMSAQRPISCSTVSAPLPFNVHLDPADLDFLKKRAEECKEKQKNPLLGEGQANPYVKIVATLEQSLREGRGTAFTKPV